jgi:uncharacterized protein (TIGR02996 family)
MQTQPMFLAAIAADPDDDLLRLAFADWLEEQGKRCWAGVLRTQVRRPRKPAPYLRSLFPVAVNPMFPYTPPHPPDMKQVVAEMGYPLDLEFHSLDRGLPARLSLDAERFLEVGDSLAAWGPMPCVHLSNAVAHLDALAGCPALSAVRSLDLSSTGFTDDALRSLLESCRLDQLAALNLGNDGWGGIPNVLTPQAARLLARTTALPALEHLCLKGTPVGDDGLAALAAGPALRKLTTLNLERCGLREAGLLTLADDAPWPALRGLNLTNNLLLPGGAAALARSPQLATLWALYVRRTNFGDEAAGILGRSPHPTQLRALDLDKNPLGDDGFTSLAESAALTSLGWLKLRRAGPRQGEGPPPRVGPRGGAALGRAGFAGSLRFLELAEQGVGDAGLSALAGAGRYPRLERLDLSYNEVGDEGVLAMVQSDAFPALKELDLSGNRIGPPGARALAGWPGLARLAPHATRLGKNPFGPDAIDLALRSKHGGREWQAGQDVCLDLEAVNLGDEGVLRLTAHPVLAHCRELQLMTNGITARGAGLLADCPAVRGLEKLELGVNPVGDEGAAALAGSPHLAGLKVLSLGACALTDAGVTAVAESPHLVGLRELVVFDNRLTAASAAALVGAPWPDLTTLYVSRAGLNGAAQQALTQRFGERVKFT